MSEITFATLFPLKDKDDAFKGLWYQRDILVKVLPVEIRLIDDFDEIKNAADCYKEHQRYRHIISTFFNSKHTIIYAKAIARNILDEYPATVPGKDCFASKPLSDIVVGVEEIMAKLKPEKRSAYVEYIDTLLDDLQTSSKNEAKVLRMLNVVNGIQKLEIAQKVSRLVVIAATWPMWAEFGQTSTKRNLTMLADRIVHPSYRGGAISEIENAEMIAEKQAELRAHLLKAEKSFKAGEFDACVSNCARILTLPYAEDAVRGKAYYLIVKCIKDYGCAKIENYDEEEFIRLAQDLGNKEAITEWDRSTIDSLISSIETGVDTCTDPGRVICNSACHAAKCFVTSLPKAHSKSWDFDYFCDTEALMKALQSDECKLLLLLDDDLKLNFDQFLIVLDQELQGNADFVKNELTICLRTDENLYSSFIDTAIKRVKTSNIKVHLIDENKLSAQVLLSRHPLFYPIRSISAKSLNSDEITINFVVITDNTGTLGEWLVREAFWMGCFNYSRLNVKITVLSPFADELESSMKGNYRGMFDSLDRLDNVSGISIDFVGLRSICSFEIEDKLDELNRYNSSFYCVTVIEDSLISFDIAKRIREWSIRRKISHGANLNDISDLPVIAFYCKDDTIAHLAGAVSVQDTAKGHSWYNNYNLVAFGSTGRVFNWNTVLGSAVEETSKCVHLQYSSVAEDSDADTINANLEGYYSRIYNRNSSRAVALSIPYRVFHMPYSDERLGIKSDHIVPLGWNILNEHAFDDPDSIESMAQLFEKGLRDKSNVEKLVVYEHARWSRYMLSRGWTSANPTQTGAFMSAGNPKQQLFIARMHGCICSTGGLPLLQKAIFDEMTDERYERYAPTGPNEDVFDLFIKYDRSNVLDTANILRRAWLKEKVLEEKQE